jgi:hypothetical protein
LADCTRTPVPVAAVAISVALLACGVFAPAAARADGDPASDVLVTQPLFVPQDAGVPPARRAQLQALLRAAGRDGFEIRVALISGPSDLGSIGELWRRPQDYARFLAAELALGYRGPLLVVMPGGYGTANARGATVAGAPGADLGAAAVNGVRRLAAAAGHRVAVPAMTTSAAAHGSTDAVAWIVFVLGAAAIVAAWAASLRAKPLRRFGGRQVE